MVTVFDLKCSLFTLFADLPVVRSCRPVVDVTVKRYDHLFAEIGPGGIRPDLASVCSPACTLHGADDEAKGFRMAAAAAGRSTSSSLSTM